MKTILNLLGKRDQPTSSGTATSTMEVRDLSFFSSGAQLSFQLLPPLDPRCRAGWGSAVRGSAFHTSGTLSQWVHSIAGQERQIEI